MALAFSAPRRGTRVASLGWGWPGQRGSGQCESCFAALLARVREEFFLCLCTCEYLKREGSSNVSVPTTRFFFFNSEPLR